MKRKFIQTDGMRSAQQLPNIADDDDGIPDPPDNLTELSRPEEIQLEEELLRDLELRQEIEKVANGQLTPTEISQQQSVRATVVRGSSASLMDPAALEKYLERPDPSARGILSTVKFIKAVVKIAVVVIRRFVTGRDHGVQATIIEEIYRAILELTLKAG